MIGRTNTGGGGGGGLNFKVVGNPQPSNPKENVIWVNTDVKITSYDFNAIEPETPVQGMVWISVGTSSTIAFNALKKNSLKVYPISAKQYISGAWVDKEAKSYQNGEWVSLEKTLLPPSTGWSFTKIQSDKTIGTGTFDGDVFTGKITANGQGIGITKQSIDFTNIRYVDVHFSESGFDQETGESGGAIALVTDNEYLSNSNEILSKWASTAECTKGVMRMDVSGISGTHRFVVGIISWGSTGSITVTKIVEVA